jgi:hypothetical protein
VSEWREWYRSRHLGELPMLDALFGWLEGNVPSTDRPSVQLWGDPGPHNLLVEGGAVTAMLDWELAHHGDPLDDLGAAVWACLGTLDAADVIAGYRSTSPFAVSAADLDYFVVLACITRSVISGIGALAFAEGRTNTLNLAGLALSLTTANLARAAVHAGWGSPPTPRMRTDTATLDPLRARPDAPEITGGVARALAEHATSDAVERGLRRDLRIAAALLRTATLLAGRTPVAAGEELVDLQGEVEARTGRRDIGLAGCARSIERDGELEAFRPRLRAALMRDLAERRFLLQPLEELYGPLVDIPRDRPFSEDTDG